MVCPVAGKIDAVHCAADVNKIVAASKKFFEKSILLNIDKLYIMSIQTKFCYTTV